MLIYKFNFNAKLVRHSSNKIIKNPIIEAFIKEKKKKMVVAKKSTGCYNKRKKET